MCEVYGFFIFKFFDVGSVSSNESSSRPRCESVHVSRDGTSSFN